MKELRNAGLLAVAFIGIAPAAAQHATMQPVFSCALGNGKQVSVTDRGGMFTYRYGTARRAELSFSSDAGSGRIHFMTQRYAGPQRQLRFSRGQYNYIVWSMDGNNQTGTASIAGLVVMRGHRSVQDLHCRRVPEFHTEVAGFDLIPQDTEAYTAM